MSCCFYLVSNACKLFSTRICSDFVPYFLSYDLCLPTLFAQANEELAAQLAALTAEKSSNSSLPASAAKSKGHTPKSGKTGGAPKPKSKTKHVQPPLESDENQSENENDGENGLTEEGSDEDTGPSEGAKLGRPGFAACASESRPDGSRCRFTFTSNGNRADTRVSSSWRCLSMLGSKRALNCYLSISLCHILSAI